MYAQMKLKIKLLFFILYSLCRMNKTLIINIKYYLIIVTKRYYVWTCTFTHQHGSQPRSFQRNRITEVNYSVFKNGMGAFEVSEQLEKAGFM